METLARAANRGSVSTGYNINNSLKLESDNSETLYRENSNGNRRTWTSSLWFKRTELTGSTAQHLLIHGVFTNGLRVFFIDEKLYMDIADETSTYYRFISNQVFRDTSAWYHMVWRVDTTSATATERARIYINGEEITWGTEPTVPQNYDTLANFSNAQIDEIQFSYRQVSNYQNSYIAEFHHVDGQSLAPTEFGEVDSDTGIWKPKAYTGTYGTNGCYLDFSNSGSLGADSSGNGNNFTLSNITSADQATDTPTNNFCTINAVNLSTQILTEGATKIVSTDNTSRTSFGTMAVSKGKWWWEGKIQVYESDDTYPCIGVTGDLDNLPATSAQLWGTNHVIKLAKSQKWVSNATGTLYGTAYADNDIINIALDMDNHIMYTYKNGTIDNASGINFSSQSAATAGNFYIPINLVYITGGGSSWEMNFGGFANYTITSAASDANGYGNFEYAPPSGYYALCSKNLAEFG